MAAPPVTIDTSALQAVQGVAGHDGMLSSAAGELIVKPCTQAEIEFYEATLAGHPDFIDYMPVYMGTLTLGSPDGTIATADTDSAADVVPKAQGKKIATSTAIVLENLEYGFVRPNVIDLKLGAKLFAPGTAEEKAARLDKVASETTSGSLNFRIAGMKVWNATAEAYDIYDKQYGRKFDKHTIQAGFTTYFEGLLGMPDIAKRFVTLMRHDMIELQEILEEDESRFYSSSILIVYEGDADVLSRRVNTPFEIKAKPAKPKPTKWTDEEADAELSETPDGYSDEDEDEESEEDEVVEPTWRMKMIDFAHSQWLPGAGKDQNVITGLRNIEEQLAKVLDNISKPQQQG